MAHFSIVVFPKDPEYLPAQPQVQAARGLLHDFFPDRENDSSQKATERPRLITAGSNFESLDCPACGARIEQFELEEDDEGETWWTRFEDSVLRSPDARSESLTMPCCKADVKAGDLRLGSDAAFARFELYLSDPGDGASLTSQQESQIGQALGAEVRHMIVVFG